MRQSYSDYCFLAHLNINSLQNKFDELQLMINKLKQEILVLTETKIDPFYQIDNSQYKIITFKERIELRVGEVS